LKPLGERANNGDGQGLYNELYALKYDINKSLLYGNLHRRYKNNPQRELFFNSLLVDNISERALSYLYCDQNLLSRTDILSLVERLQLDKDYLAKVLFDNKRPIEF